MAAPILLLNPCVSTWKLLLVPILLLNPCACPCPCACPLPWKLSEVPILPLNPCVSTWKLSQVPILPLTPALALARALARFPGNFGSTYSAAPPRASTWKLSEVPILLLPLALAHAPALARFPGNFHKYLFCCSPSRLPLETFTSPYSAAKPMRMPLPVRLPASLETSEVPILLLPLALAPGNFRKYLFCCSPSRLPMPLRLPASLETFTSTYSAAPPRACPWKLLLVPILLLNPCACPCPCACPLPWKLRKYLFCCSPSR